MKTQVTLLLLCVWVARAHASALRTDSLQRSVASVHLEATRSANGLQRLYVEAFNQRHTLNLQPSSSPFAKGFKLQKISKNEQGRSFVEDISHHEDHDEIQLYEDRETGGVVHLTSHGVEGLLSPSLALKVGNDGQHEAVRQDYETIPSQYIKDYLEVPEEVGSLPNPSFISREAVKVTVEMYIIVDSTLAAQLGSNRKVKKYLGVFWNAVNQRFATFTDPEIKLALAGALIIRDSSDETFINENVLTKNYIDGDKTIDSLGVWLYQKKSLPSHDMVYLMTAKDMALVQDGTIQEGLAGIAYFSAACRVLDSQQRSLKAAMGEASSSFAGVLTAAHEVAHNLGSPHDGSDGAEACSWNNGYIMSYVTGTTNQFLFSSCSQQLMKQYIKGSSAACLHTNTASNQIALSSKLPGDELDMDKQCQQAFGESSAYASTSASEDSLCLNLKCEMKKEEGLYIYTYFKWIGPALEGSPCRSGGACRNGACTTNREG